MTKINEIYRCNTCENIVQTVAEGNGKLICCGKEMELLEPKQIEDGKVKHVPIITKEDDKIVVTIGENPHPMEENHHIVFVELIVGNQIYRTNLNNSKEAKAIFKVDAAIEDVKAIEYCNIHGLWHS